MGSALYSSQLPANPRDAINKVVMPMYRAPDTIQKDFDSAYKIIARRRWWVPFRKRIRLVDVVTGESYRLDYGLIRLFFEVVPEPNSDRMYQKAIEKINKK